MFDVLGFLGALPRHRNRGPWIGLVVALMVALVSPKRVSGHYEPRADTPVTILQPVEEDRSMDGERERMVVWQRRNRQAMESVKRRWLGALRANDRILWRDPAPACTELLEVLESTGVSGLLMAPDPVVRIHLGRSLDQLRAAAGACSRGRYFESTYLFREAARSFLEVKAFLSRHGLSP